MNLTKLATQRGERTINARLAVASLTGSQVSSVAAEPEGWTQVSAAKTGTGVYVVNFLKPFAGRTPTVTATPLHASQKNFCTIAAVSTSSVTINVWNDTGVAADPTEVHLHITGFDVTDQI